tara:strand:+ start:572 stop:847 length:276 start_codon:yes stop_codon:yes gene_type:complete
MKNNFSGPCERLIQELSELPKRRIWYYKETSSKPGENSLVVEEGYDRWTGEHYYVELCYDKKEHEKSVNDLDKVIDNYHKRQAEWADYSSH